MEWEYYELNANCFLGKNGDIVRVRDIIDNDVWENITQRKTGSTIGPEWKYLEKIENDEKLIDYIYTKLLFTSDLM